MKALFMISLLISTVMCSYLSGLSRSFSKADFQMIDLHVTMPPSEVEKLIQIAQIGENQVSNGQAKNLEDFVYKEATLVATLNGQDTTYENVTFKTGGMYARSNDKVGYNIKLDKKFLGRKQIRIRPDPNDRAYLRQKISCDIANRIGLPSIQSAYARLYINDEFWGLYTLMDTIKPSWIKQTYKPSAEEVTDLIQCKYDGMNLKPGSESLCLNANEDFPDMTSFSQFVNQVNSASTYEELEKIMDVEEFLKFMAMEWLIGSFDHFLVLGHNFYFYKRETDNKWVIIEYDYDNTFGNGVQFPVYWQGKRTGASSMNNQNQQNQQNQQNNGGWGNFGFGSFGNSQGNNVMEYSFPEWELDIPIIKTLVLDNPDKFKEIVREVLVSAFNPSLLSDHIDQIKQFLLPYVKEDTTPGSDGRLPGRINKRGNQNNSSVSDFERNIEGNVNGVEGVKSWIKGKFEVACKQYGFDQSEILSEAQSYSPKGFDLSGSGDDNTNSKPTQNTNTPQTPAPQTNTTPEVNTVPEANNVPAPAQEANTNTDANNNNQWSTNNNNNNDQWNNNQWNNNNNNNNNNNQWNNQWNNNNNNNNNQWNNNNNNNNNNPWNNNNQWNNNNNNDQWNNNNLWNNNLWNNNNQWNNNNNNNQWSTNNAVANDDCWSDVLGYSCCKGCSVYYTDKDGNWGVEHGQWCGIKESVCEANAASGQCYGATTRKYPCCKECKVVLTDKNGRWGVENNSWCSISDNC